MNIKLYKHNSIDVEIDDDLQKVVEYYNSDFVKQYINEPVSFTIQNTSLNLKDIPLEGEFVMVVYKTGTFPVYGQTFPPRNGTILMYVSVNQIEDKIEYSWKVMVHEILHAITYKVMAEKKVFIPNVLDFPVIDGVLKSYWKNDNPYATDGNFSVALKALAPFYKKEVGYKYFSEKEAKNMTLEFMLFADELRHRLGFPLSDSSPRSSFRTPAENKLAGGVPNSAHLKGKAKDWRVIEGAKKYQFIEEAQKLAKEKNVIIGIGSGDTFMHLDVGHRTENTAWNYK